MINSLIHNQINLIFAIILIILIAWNILLSLKNWQIKKKLKTFFNGKNASDLEGVLFEEIKRLKKAENNIEELYDFSKKLKKITDQSLRKVSVTRFNPFKETGGDQSFVIVLLDSKNDGLIISSLFTREGTRVYTKPIKSGQSIYPLSKEEIESLKKVGVKTK